MNNKSNIVLLSVHNKWRNLKYDHIGMRSSKPQTSSLYENAVRGNAFEGDVTRVKRGCVPGILLIRVFGPKEREKKTQDAGEIV